VVVLLSFFGDDESWQDVFDAISWRVPVAGALFYATMPKKAKEMSTKEIENKNQQTLSAQKKGLQKD